MALGLTDGDALILQLNLDDDLTITVNGPFTFPTPLANGSFYYVTVLTPPAGKTCSVAHNEGYIRGSDVTDVEVICTYNLPAIYIYETMYSLKGNLGQSDWTNLICKTSYGQRDLSIGCTKFVSLLGYSYFNGVTDFPSAYHLPTEVEIRLSDNTIVSDNWYSFINHDPPLSMSGTADFPVARVWSGFKSEGGISPVFGNCDDWSNSSYGTVAMFLDALNDSWRMFGMSCTFDYHFICLCW